MKALKQIYRFCKQHIDFIPAIFCFVMFAYFAWLSRDNLKEFALCIALCIAYLHVIMVIKYRNEREKLREMFWRDIEATRMHENIKLFMQLKQVHDYYNLDTKEFVQKYGHDLTVADLSNSIKRTLQ